MDDIRIFVAHSPDSRDICIRRPFLCHVAAGSSLWTRPVPQGMLRDDAGEHISGKNRAYCELTVQYYAWKNVRADYYGFCHYRRYFSFAPRPLPEDLDDTAGSRLLVDHRRDHTTKDQSQQYIQCKGNNRVIERAKTQGILNRGKQENICGGINSQCQGHR